MRNPSRVRALLPLVFLFGGRVARGEPPLSIEARSSTTSSVSSAPRPEKAEAPRIDFSGAPGEGATVRFGDRFSLNVRTRFQLRYHLGIPPEPASGDRKLDQLVNINTARLWFSGHVFTKDLTYLIQLAMAGRDYRDGATSPVYDAYLDWRTHRDFGVRAGQFFVPFDRLRTVRESALQMPDRPKPVQELTLDRDAGIMVYSDRFLGDHSPLAWRLGAFGGGGTNLTKGREPGVLLVGRVELRPLGPIDDDKEGDLSRRPRPALAIGGAFASNFNTNRLRGTTGSTFEGGTTDDLHAAADLVFKWLGLALEAEYLWRHSSKNAILSTAPDGTPRVEPTRSGQGWIIQASYVFEPPIEVVGRLARLYASRGTDPSLVKDSRDRGQEIGAGVNYYFNEHKLKMQLGWVARMPFDFDIGRADHAVDLQLDVTF